MLSSSGRYSSKEDPPIEETIVFTSSSSSSVILNRDDETLKEEFVRLLSEQNDRHQQEMNDMKEEMNDLRTELAQSKDDLEALGFSSSIVDVAPRDRKQSLNKKDDSTQDEEVEPKGVEIPLLPHDTFSYLAFVKFRSKAMWIAIMVIFVQFTSIAVLLLDTIAKGSQQNWIGVPAGVSPATSVIQVLTLFIGVFSQTDFQDSLNTLLVGYHAVELKENCGVDVSYRRWLISLLTRFFVALMGLLATFFLIVTNSEASEILLDFTAIEFITNLDNIFFWLTAWGYVGCSAQRDAATVVEAKTLKLVSLDAQPDNVEQQPTRQQPQYQNEDDNENIVNEDDQEFGGHPSESSRIKKKRQLFAKRTTSQFDVIAKSRQVLDGAAGQQSRRTKRSNYGIRTGITKQWRNNQQWNDNSRHENNHRMSLFYSSGGGVSDMFLQFSPMQKSSLTTQKEMATQTRQCPRFLFLCLIYVCLFGGWFFIFYRQKTGHYLCQTVYVQFNDELNPEIASFTGLYNYQCPDNRRLCNRGIYLEEGHGRFHHSAKFGFCDQKPAWTFSYKKAYDGSSIPDACDDWKVASEEVNDQHEASFDLLALADEQWHTKNRIGAKVPMPPFTLQCFDCSQTSLFCGGQGRGECINNRCVCKEGWSGPRCQFRNPCQKLEIDPLYPSFQGTREWASNYIPLEVNSTAVEVYSKPVYIGVAGGKIDRDAGPPVRGRRPEIDVVFYTGRRWAMTTSTSLMQQGSTPDELGRFFTEEFHARWSRMTLSFVSTSVDSESPTDSNSPTGIVWYQAASQNNDSFQGVDQSRPIESRYLCATCHNETNPCVFEGICTPAGTCDCVTGSSGQLCQLPPVSNGLCDVYFNTPEFGFDGGDCCEETCKSTAQHTCGKGIIENSVGIDAVGVVGYPHCEDPLLGLHGSLTLSAINRRGFVRCGLVPNPTFINDFETDICRAIAGAVLGDSEAIDIVWVEFSERFPALQKRSFDVLMRTDHTANRDIHEKWTGAALVSTPVSYLYTGLTVGGLAPYPSCAENLDTTSPECANLKICMSPGTTWFDTIHRLFSDSIIVEVADFSTALDGIQAGLCDAVAASNLDLDPLSVQSLGFDFNNYETATRLFDKSFLTLVTQSNDRTWSQFVSWVLQALIEAQESGVTKDTAHLMKTTDAFGDTFVDMFRNAVAANGNYGELWNKNMLFEQAGMNLVNNGTTGLIISNQLGEFQDEGPPPVPGGQLATIIDRGVLFCGVTGFPGFGKLDEATREWKGFEVDICRAIAASLDVDAEIIHLSSVSGRFSAILSGALDLVFGFTHTLEREVRHKDTGEAFDFSPTYFYDGLVFGGRLPYGRCANDLRFDGVCRDLLVCVPDGSTWLDTVRKIIPEKHIVVTETFDGSLEGFANGLCNVAAGETALLTEESLRIALPGVNLTGYEVGTTQYTKEPLGIMTRSTDPQFSVYVRWIVFALFYAEETQVLQSGASSMPVTNLFGPDLTRIWQKAIAAAGCYGEIWDRNLDGLVSREGRNRLNDINEPGPQLFANPGTF